MIRNQPAARWFPSRRRFALSKLLAFGALRMHCAGQNPPPAESFDDGRQLVLVIHRDQDFLEIHTVTILHFAVVTCFLASLIPLPLPLSILLVAPLEPLLALLVCFITGLVMSRWSAFRKQDDMNFQQANGVVLMGLTLAAALDLFRHAPDWAWPVGALFLGITILNALAWVAVRLLQSEIARWEQRCVA